MVKRKDGIKTKQTDFERSEFELWKKVDILSYTLTICSWDSKCYICQGCLYLSLSIIIFKLLVNRKQIFSDKEQIILHKMHVKCIWIEFHIKILKDLCKYLNIWNCSCLTNVKNIHIILNTVLLMDQGQGPTVFTKY